MAKRVAAQRRGLLYGMIAAIFVAVLMAVFLFIKINEIEEFKKLVHNPKNPERVVASDIEGLKTDINATLAAVAKQGVSPADGSVSLLSTIKELTRWNAASQKACGFLASEISGESVSGVYGEPLEGLADTIAAAGKKSREEARAALDIVPQTGLAASTPERSTDVPNTLKDAINDMSVHIRAVVNACDAKDARIKVLEADVAEAKRNGESLLATMKQAFDEAKAAKDAQILKLQGEITEALAQTDKVRKDYDAARMAHNNDLAKHKDEIQEKVNKIIELDSRIAELVSRLARQMGRAYEPDGIVRTLKPGETTGYINRGSAHAVFNGMTFAILDPRELGKEVPHEKGAIRLTKVMEHSSEFVIIKQDPSNPIVVGDIIVNLAYDLERPFHFALVGKLDIGNDRVEDSSRIKQIITDFGGKVQDKVSVETDYIVVGDDPMNWAPKGSGPQVQGIINKLMEEQKQMGLATDMARRLHIPVLNLNRFMSLMGK